MGRRNWGHHGPSWRRSLTACCRATSLSASSSGAPGNLDPDEWAILRRVIDLIKTNANGAELGPVLETIENALRADQAISIAALSDLADRRRGSTGDLFAEFKANRELIEAIASALFDRSSNVETRVVSIFSKHIRRGRFGRLYSARRRPRRTVK